ncbi:MAG: MerR family copper efflux transcriptional regulator [Planctomycetota bacterium]|jgi:MerR family copper efflux transcriptional regulator
MAAPTDELIKIGDFARLANTNLRTLRYYEELGLLIPAKRSAGGFRYYRPSDVNRVRMIHDLQTLGLQLDRIGELMLRPDPDAESSSRVRQLEAALTEQKSIIEQRVEALLNQRDQIDKAMQRLGNCRTCHTHPTAENNFCDPCTESSEPLSPILSALF